MAFWDQFIGGPKTETSTTVVTDKPSSNTGLIVGGIAIAIIAIVGLIWLFGGFKKKQSGTA